MESKLPERLKILRKRQSIKQQDLAKVLDLTVYQLSRYENGHSDPTPNMIIKLARYFDVSTDYLLGMTEHLDNDILKDQSLTQYEKEKVINFLGFLRHEK